MYLASYNMEETIMIGNYFRMKAKEIRLKLALYSVIEEFVNEKTDIVVTIKKLYLAMKDTSVEELQNKFINSLASIIHEENKKVE